MPPVNFQVTHGSRDGCEDCESLTTLEFPPSLPVAGSERPLQIKFEHPISV